MWFFPAVSDGWRKVPRHLAFARWNSLRAGVSVLALPLASRIMPGFAIRPLEHRFHHAFQNPAFSGAVRRVRLRIG